VTQTLVVLSASHDWMSASHN